MVGRKFGTGRAFRTIKEKGWNGFNPEDADERTALVKKHTAIELFRDFCRGAVHQNHPHVLLRLIELLSGTDRLGILPVNEEQ